MAHKHVKSVEEFIKEINTTIESWDKINPRLAVAWFRGDRKENKKLRPKLFSRLDQIKKDNVKNTFENDIMQEFRMRAPALYTKTPPYERIDEWLFLARHNELPTRLLDWTEGALFALFFAINKIVSDYLETNKKSQDSPVVWMLNPIMFNFVASGRMFLPLSWNDRSNLYDKNTHQLDLAQATDGEIREKAERGECDLKWFACPGNIGAAFALPKKDDKNKKREKKIKYEEKYPIALKPQHIHPRVTAQRSCFTVHGKDKRGIEKLFKNSTIKDLINNYPLYPVNEEEFPDVKKVLKKIQKYHGRKSFNELFLKKIKISPDKKDIEKMMEQLRVLGVSHSTLIPELTGLANELDFGTLLRLR